jgi:hypothetical protein
MELSNDRYDNEHRLRQQEVELTPFYQTEKHKPEKSAQPQAKIKIFACGCCWGWEWRP